MLIPNQKNTYRAALGNRIVASDDLSSRQKKALLAFIVRIPEDLACKLMVEEDETGQSHNWQGIAGLLLMLEEMEFVRPSKNDSDADAQDVASSSPWLLQRGAVIRRIILDLKEAESIGALEIFSKCGMFEFRATPALMQIASLLGMVEGEPSCT